ncbi:hypothetical protein KPL40_19055 [Clostridium gasigenes]|uniref:hypothetical protein n=1 Tax=Clostridium gasigenes TaxID=94869 RepID=UPI001C0DB9FF|nr:hypothetical protein [Clostridium gasigenes]MBU3134515.1 hypothetical protein [Clostridium gasigenes]
MIKILLLNIKSLIKILNRFIKEEVKAIETAHKEELKSTELAHKQDLKELAKVIIKRGFNMIYGYARVSTIKQLKGNSIMSK